jgi:CRP-like cAMP-binding protein
MHVQSNGVRENRLLSLLGPEDRARLEPFLERIHLASHQTLATQHQPLTHVYFPIDAVTSTLLELPDGESIEVGLMGAEGLTGLNLLYGVARSSTTVIAQIPGAAVRMPAQAFVREVVQSHGSMFQLMLRYSNAFNEMVAEVAACNASHSVEQRCARWILLAHDRVGRDSFPLTHEYLALMLGVRRASVSSAASLLRLGGAIDYSRGHVSITDRDRLIAAACGCYGAMVATMEEFFESTRERAER